MTDRFCIHVYEMDIRPRTYEYYAQDLATAQEFAKKEFVKSNVYKVNVWDLTLGGPNPVDRTGLVLQLV